MAWRRDIYACLSVALSFMMSVGSWGPLFRVYRCVFGKLNIPYSSTSFPSRKNLLRKLVDLPLLLCQSDASTT